MFPLQACSPQAQAWYGPLLRLQVLLDAPPAVRALHEEQLPVPLLLPPPPPGQPGALRRKDTRVLGLQELGRVKELVHHHREGLR